MTAQTPQGGFRTEHDSLGEVRVPADRLWGAQTQRALGNFTVGGDRFRWDRSVIRALGLVKKCAALANVELGELPLDKATPIVRAADEVASGRLDAEFPLGVFQSGSGTQSNMNANEVIANRASQLGGVRVHPNDDVNRGQSSNDVFPTVMHLAAVEEVETKLVPAVAALHATLEAKAREFAGIVIVGRTHLQDATPMTLGQVFSGWAAQLEQALAAVRRTLPDLHELALGGTAVGTGLNAHPQFAEIAIAKLAAETGRPFVPARNRFAANSSHEGLVNLSAALRTLAVVLLKVGNDVRWYSSGPRAGLAELRLPENEPGSSIMPGKINPTQTELLTQVAVQVFGNDAAVAFAGSQGHFQLNAYRPLILHNVLESVTLLADACRSFNDRCAAGIEPNEKRIREHLHHGLMLATALNPHIGYEKAAQIALAAHREGITLREAAVKSGHLTAEQFDAWVRPEEMTRPRPPARSH